MHKVIVDNENMKMPMVTANQPTSLNYQAVQYSVGVIKKAVSALSN